MSKKNSRTLRCKEKTPTSIINPISVKRSRNSDCSDSSEYKSAVKIEDIEELVNNYSLGILSYDADQLPVQFVRTSLLNWYSHNRRKLPWRGDLDFEKSENVLALETAEEKINRKLRVSAYGTWISEVMCQQTRVETVISYWNRWMEVSIDLNVFDRADIIKFYRIFQRFKLLHWHLKAKSASTGQDWDTIG